MNYETFPLIGKIIINALTNRIITTNNNEYVMVAIILHHTLKWFSTITMK